MPEVPFHPSDVAIKRSPELTRERLARMNSIEITVGTDLSPVLESMNQFMHKELKARGDGFHVTIIGPAEKSIFNTLTDEQIAQIDRLSKNLQSGLSQVTVSGIGYISGDQPNMRELDKGKETCFVAIEIPDADALRTSIGLPKKYFHVTLGFIGADIHLKKIGSKPRKENSPVMVDITEMIEKVADPSFASISIPKLEFRGLAEPEEVEVVKTPIVEPAAPKKEKRQAIVYDMDDLGNRVVPLIREQSILTEEEITKFLELAQTNPNAMGGVFSAKMAKLLPLLKRS